MKIENQISEQFLLLVNKILIMDKNTVLTVDEGIKLYPSEIHLIIALGTGQAKDFGGLVCSLGITKGAVSQTITRLVKKGILVKEKSEGTNELSLSFSPSGKATLKACLKFRSGLEKQLLSYLSAISSDEKETINRFLNHIGQMFD